MTYSNTIAIQPPVVTASFPSQYMNWAFKLKCFQTICPLFPNAKEWTESFGCFQALKKVSDWYDLLKSKMNIKVIIPGDGVSPRTGSLMCNMTPFNVYSVDPLIRISSEIVHEPVFNNVKFKRLTCIKSKIEDVGAPFMADIAIIINCHSHALLQECYNKVIADRIIIVALECCVPQVLHIKGNEITPNKIYRDNQIWSPQNLVKIWDITK